MSVKGYDMVPKEVPLVKTKHREICTQIPVPESMGLLKRLYNVESFSLHWQYPIFWDRAEGFNVYDKFGNKWLDMSSGIAVANAGHSRKEVIEEIIKQANHGLLYNFTFPSEIRMKFLEKLIEFTPSYLNNAFLMSSGSEACENTIKLMRGYGHTIGGNKKNIIISFNNAFHGRTLGAQMIGGLPGLKNWINNPDPEIFQVPFPDGFWNTDISFDLFEKSVKDLGINLENVCGVIVEGFQGANVEFLPIEYAQKLRQWCTDHNALMVYDEVQSGFCRTGKKFAFELYGVEPDIISLGKGISGSLPISATVARKEIMDVFPPGSMTSTHTGNPLACAAAIKTLEIYESEKLWERAEKLGKEIFEPAVQKLIDKYDIIAIGYAKGLIGSLQICDPGTKNPNKQLAYDIDQRLIEKGIMVFAPVGRATLKMAPPLIITEEALKEAFDVYDEAIGEIVKEKNLS